MADRPPPGSRKPPAARKIFFPRDAAVEQIKTAFASKYNELRLSTNSAFLPLPRLAILPAT
jgi:hypothetical protein